MEINRELIQRIRKEYGEAFYILDSNMFKTNYNELKSAFSAIYGDFNLAYSYKTNYTPKLCKIVKELGGYAEVVSEMEVRLALQCGVSPEKIIWNGPIKKEDEIKNFLLQGGNVNVDSIEEAEYIHRIAQNEKKHLNVGIRCNYDVGDGVVSRFGLDVTGKDFWKTFELLTSSENIHFTGFQCHYAKRDLDYWPARVNKMLKLIDQCGIIPERIDIGGGLYGKMEESLKKQFSKNIPTYADYAKIVATEFNDYFSDKCNRPELLIEPGTALVGNCMQFVGTVKTIKSIRGKKFATVLGSQKNINMGGVNPPITVINMGTAERLENVDFVGYTCIEGDILYRNYSGNIAEGDVVIFNNCGSYSLVMKPPFILPNFPMIEIENNEITVIKTKEDFYDIFHTFQI